MITRPFTAAAPLVFSVIAVMQLMRMLKGWTVIINGFTIPLWVSGAAFIFLTCCAVGLWHENWKKD